MTRELNVRITLEENDGYVFPSDEALADMIKNMLLNWVGVKSAQVEVHTATPESANPKEGECKYYKEGDYSDCLIDNGICPWFPSEQGRKCKYYEPKREC